MKHYVIQCKANLKLFWSNDQGWVDRLAATMFTEHKQDHLHLPVNGKWLRTDPPILVELWVPAIWNDLLQIEEFDQLEEYPANACHGRAGDFDPDPYRDDSRTVCVSHGRFTVSLYLCSGSNNYWLAYEVYDNQNDIPVIEGEPFNDLAPTQTVDDVGVLTQSATPVTARITWIVPIEKTPDESTPESTPPQGESSADTPSSPA